MKSLPDCPSYWDPFTVNKFVTDIFLQNIGIWKKLKSCRKQVSSYIGKQQAEIARESPVLDTALAQGLGAQRLKSADLCWKKCLVSTKFNRICANYYKRGRQDFS